MAMTAMILLLLRGVAAILAIIVVRFLYHGYAHRRAVRSLKAQGLPILPHSILFGHLPIFAKFKKAHPPDINVYVFHTWLAENCKTYFPDHDYLPSVVYLDIWPLTGSLAMVTDPVAVSQFTIAKNEPKVDVVAKFFHPMTLGLDTLTTEGQIWKTWRPRFNPGFSQRNLTALMPEIIEEVSIFADRLKQVAGKGDESGPVFPLMDMTTDLTFDVIGRATLDIRLHSQTDQSDSDSLKKTFFDQIRLMEIFENIAQGVIIGRWPWQQAAVARNNRTMHNFLLPQIQKRLHSDSWIGQKATVLDLAIKHVDTDAPDGSQKEPTLEFVDRLIANLKTSLFAGHDTTAATICFMMKLLQDYPECLEKIRAEHDAVLGINPDPAHAAQVLTTSPHLLHSLPYSLGVIKETLRLYPLAATVRQPPPGYYLTGADSVKYPMDRFGLWASAPAIQRHPRYWPRPNEFLPERWMVSEGDPLYPATPNSWIPFSLGPRNCIGMELAHMELKLVLVLTARTLEIQEAWSEWDVLKGAKSTPSHTVDGQRLYQIGTGLVHPKDGMPVHVRLRK
ncbi:vera protein [Apiospora hydei]|uniref:Vera protein n=1 Tax=Apiospora hydei TaxID=1337664 RepID=A0ABR1UXY1_9PEZI